MVAGGFDSLVTIKSQLLTQFQWWRETRLSAFVSVLMLLTVRIPPPAEVQLLLDLHNVL